MRKRILTFIAACLYYSGLVALARRRAYNEGHRLIILNYHQASGGNLRQHLLYLRRHYRILHLETALAELQYPEYDPGEQCRPMLALTFDDGYHDNYTHGLPLARELEVPFTVFLIPGYIDSGAPFWWLEGARMVQRSTVECISLAGQTYHLHQVTDRRLLARAIDARLRASTSVAERERTIAELYEQLDSAPPAPLEEEATRPLSWAEVRKMEESGYISFGAHTLHHPILAHLADPAEVRREVEEARTTLEQYLGYRVRTFAYPVGQPRHIGTYVVNVVRQAGYDWALTAQHGINTPRDDPYLLRRIEADVSQHWLVVAAEAAGLWGFVSWLRWRPLLRRIQNRP